MDLIITTVTFYLGRCYPTGSSLPSCLSQPIHLLYLEGYFGGHGEAVGDDWLLLCGPSFPAVQLHTATTRQEDLSIHLHRRVSSQLASCKTPTKRTPESHEARKTLVASQKSFSTKANKGFKSPNSCFQPSFYLNIPGGSGTITNVIVTPQQWFGRRANIRKKAL